MTTREDKYFVRNPEPVLSVLKSASRIDPLGHGPLDCCWRFCDVSARYLLLSTAIFVLSANAGAQQQTAPMAAPTSQPTTAPSRLDPAIAVQDVNGASCQPLLTARKDGAKGVVFIFIATDCPISNGYAPEITRICGKYCRPADATAGKTKGFDFYLVYADPDVKAADARKHAADFSLTCPLLVDPKKELAKRLDATVTPEACVVSTDGQIRYVGRIDNLYSDFGKRRFDATTHDLRDALEAVASGRPVASPRLKAVGCPI